jgi:AraC family transcriptional regulator
MERRGVSSGARAPEDAELNQDAAQRHRVNRVINFVHANMNEPLNLDILAETACLSKFHFSRVFLKHCGQTPLRYLWRSRLERAARRLAFDTDRSITDVSLDCGFASPQAFSQAFKARFGSSPNSFRASPLWIPQAFPIEPRSRTPGATMIRIENRPPCRIAYLRHFGPYRRESGGIARTFDRLEAWARRRGMALADLPRIGLCPDNRRITPGPCCVYDACLAVPPEFNEDQVVSIQTIPAGRYAVLSIECPNEQLLSFWEWFVGDWRRTSGENYEPRWSHEVFHPSSSGAFGPEHGVELCLRLGD